MQASHQLPPPEASHMKQTKGVVNMEHLRKVLLDPNANQKPPYVQLFIFCQEIARSKGRVDVMEVTVISRSPEAGIPETYDCEFLCGSKLRKTTIPACFVTLEDEVPGGDHEQADIHKKTNILSMPVTASV